MGEIVLVSVVPHGVVEIVLVGGDCTSKCCATWSGGDCTSKCCATECKVKKFWCWGVRKDFVGRKWCHILNQPTLLMHLV